MPIIGARYLITLFYFNKPERREVLALLTAVKLRLKEVEYLSPAALLNGGAGILLKCHC